MYCSFLAFDLAVVFALLTSCEQGAYESAASGATAPLETPVGPVPGPQPAAQAVKNPYEGDLVATAEGRSLFVRYNCSGCHGDYGGGGMGPSLRDLTWRYGSSDGQVFNSVAQGRAHGMPAWGVKLPSDQIWKLVAYIHTMRTKNEPSPPNETIPPGPMP
jgi:cytochrome c oxidase cbb3-type subunit 3